MLFETEAVYENRALKLDFGSPLEGYPSVKVSIETQDDCGSPELRNHRLDW